jgi:hypothetical protein
MKIEMAPGQAEIVAQIMKVRNAAQSQLDLVVAVILAGHGVEPTTPVVGIEGSALIVEGD